MLLPIKPGLVVDGCAGPGGWDVHAEELGLDVVGVEYDDDACATRRAAGLRTVQDDVARLHPFVFMDVFGRPEGIIFSPPCQLFSSAGKGHGRAIMRLLLHGITRAAQGASDEELARVRRGIRSELRELLAEEMGFKAKRRTRAGTYESTPITRAQRHAEADRMARNVCLVWQPLRWTARLRPRWVALEQVPPVLPLWQAAARALEGLGYRTWAGVLSAERYGVPQTRKRAFMLASLDGTPHPPEPTHQEYVPGEPAREADQGSLFGEALQPWVSMAQALGWGSGRVGFPRRDDLGTSEDGYRERDWRSTDEPAFSMTEKQRSFVREVNPESIEVELRRSDGSGGRRPRKGTEPAPTIRGGAGGGCGTNLEITFRNGTHDHRAERDQHEPAPTLHFGERLNTVTWECRQPNSTKGGTRPEGLSRSIDDPARTLDSRVDQWEIVANNQDNATVRGLDEDDPEASWARERPATTVAGDPRVFPPGHKLNADDLAAGRDGQLRSGAGSSNGDARTAAVRVSVEEAAVLQSFPPWWPWQGTRTAIFQQVGNAVPPGMARPVLEAARAPTLRSGSATPTPRSTT